MLKPMSASAFLGILIAASGFGQLPAPPERPSAPPLSFEVATIKRTDPSFPGTVVGGFRVGRFSAQGFTLKDLMSYTYDVDNRQIVGGPKWSDSEKYDVVGKPEKNRSSKPGHGQAYATDPSIRAVST